MWKRLSAWACEADTNGNGDDRDRGDDGDGSDDREVLSNSYIKVLGGTTSRCEASQWSVTIVSHVVQAFNHVCIQAYEEQGRAKSPASDLP